MSTEIVVYILTALAAVVVVLTRMRLSGDGGAGRVEVAGSLLNVHTVAGTLALLTWVAYLFADGGKSLGGALTGIVALALWWLTAVVGLLILVRWLPTRGRHADRGRQDSWSEGPGLSVLAHVGMLVGVLVFTYAYAESLV